MAYKDFFLLLQGQPPQHRGSGGCPREPFPPLPGHGAVRRPGTGWGLGGEWGPRGLGQLSHLSSQGDRG